jgi:hypothetical protein
MSYASTLLRSDLTPLSSDHSGPSTKSVWVRGHPLAEKDFRLVVFLIRRESWTWPAVSGNVAPDS